MLRFLQFLQLLCVATWIRDWKLTGLFASKNKKLKIKRIKLDGNVAEVLAEFYSFLCDCKSGLARFNDNLRKSC